MPVDARAEGARRPVVVVLGGGFAGVGAARKLKKADADVVVVDKHDYHTFQPLLYQLATGLLETSAVGHSLRDLVHDQDNVTIHKTSVTAIDLDAREVRFAEMEPLTYDFLVLALGAEVNFFGTDGAAEHAFPMYTLTDAVRLKEHMLERWEAADKDPSLMEDGALNVVVVGGGPTGVESAGAIAELYRGDFARDYPNVSQERARVVLVEAGPEVFSMFKPNLRAYTEEALQKRTVEVMTGQAVASVSPTRVTLKSGTGDARAHARVGRRPSGQPARAVARARAGAREPDRRRAGPRRSRSSRGLRRRRYRRDLGREDRTPLAAARLRRAPVGGARRRDDRQAPRGQGVEALQVPRQGDDGDDRSRRRRGRRCSADGR